MPDTHPAMTAPASNVTAIPPSYIPECSKTMTHLLPALFTLQCELDPITKTEKNQHLRATYADLKAVWAAIREPLKEQGLLVLQEPHPNLAGALVTTTVIHVESGEWRRSTLFVPSLAQYQKASGTSEYTAQGHGSALTYCRKYSLLTVLGLCTEDDDGHAATHSPPPQAKPAPTTEASEAGWNAWAQRQQLQMEGCENESQLIACWMGMQPELKKADEGVRARLTAVKEKQKQRWAAVAQDGIDPDGDVPF